MTKVINISENDEYDIYIGRSGKGKDGYFGNPFTTGTRSEKIENFKNYALRRIETDEEYRENVKKLYGKTLGCFCKPKRCHGDILAELAKKLTLEDELLK